LLLGYRITGHGVCNLDLMEILLSYLAAGSSKGIVNE
jgi:hypothetical protein